MIDYDIGSPAHAGSSSLSGSTWTVTGGGSDIWGTADQFHFLAFSMNGDCSISARVASETGGADYVKTGVMVRQSSDASSMFYDVLVRKNQAIDVESRTTYGGSVGNPYSGAVIAPPEYVKIVKTGTTLKGYTSSDGVTWTLVDTSTIAFTGTYLVGLCVCAHDNTITVTGTFDTIVITGTTTYAVTLAGSPVTVVAGTLSADLGLGKRGSASFLVKQPDTSTHYTQYQPVQMYDQSATLIFSGYIDTPQEMQPGHAAYLTNQMTCMDQRWITDKRVIFANGPFPDTTLFPSTILYPAQATQAKVYTNRPYDVIVADIFNTILKQEGVTIGMIFTGPLPSPTLFPATTLFPNGASQAISSVTFNYPTVTQALDALVKAASANNVTFYWSIDQNKALWFVPYTYNVNSTVVDGTHIDQVNNPPYVSRANPLYRNTQYVEGGIGGGASAQNAAQVTAQKALDGTSGIVESALKDTNIVSRADGLAESKQLLNVYCFPGALRFVFTTNVSGYLPGQQITVTYAPFNFSSTKMLVESMHLDDALDKFNIWYTITAIIGPYDATWAQFFGKMLAPSGVSSASSISIGI